MSDYVEKSFLNMLLKFVDELEEHVLSLDDDDFCRQLKIDSDAFKCIKKSSENNEEFDVNDVVVVDSVISALRCHAVMIRRKFGKKEKDNT